MRDFEVGRLEGKEAPSGSGDQRRTRLAVVASSSITTALVFSGPLITALRDLAPGSFVLLRRPRTGDPAWVETVIAGMVGSVFLPAFEVRWFAPQLGGRDQTYRRDFDLVEAATEVLAIFDGDRVMSGGTGHVVEAAIVRGIPVTAWALTDRGGFVRVGELDHV